MGGGEVNDTPVTGGCQCGAIRYSIDSLGRATICHCRMCQKAFGSFFGPLVTARGLKWTRGTPSVFASSNKVNRHFCSNCGTPLTYDWGGGIEISIGSLDDPEQAAPVLQLNLNDKLSFVDDLHRLPKREMSDGDGNSEFIASIRTNQHPDHDTPKWPVEE